MFLYHGTFQRNYEKIKEENIIKKDCCKWQTTDSIDCCISDYGDDYTLRNEAVFLFNDMKYMGSFDYIFKIDIEDLNTNLLYVADFEISTNILTFYVKDEKEKIKEAVKKYKNNFMPFKDYIKNKNNIAFPEFLYFENISLKKVDLVDIVSEYFSECKKGA